MFSIYMCMMLLHEGHVFELQIETKFEVCGTCSFFNATYVVPKKAWKIPALTGFEPWRAYHRPRHNA